MAFLAIDAGNTNIVFGVMDKDSIYMSCRLETDRFKTGDEYAVIFRNLLEIHGIDRKTLEGGIISSVVPELKKVLQDAVYSITEKTCMIVGPGLKNGLKIRIDNPAQLGSDRVAEAVAAIAEYPKPILIFDMGTATTFSVIDSKGQYVGCLIMPGVTISLEALAAHTAQLPHISLADGPRGVIGTNTNDSIINGVIYSNAAVFDGLTDRLSKELADTPTVIATGGLSEMLIPYCKKNVILDKELLLKGLRIIYLKNRKD